MCLPMTKKKLYEEVLVFLRHFMQTLHKKTKAWRASVIRADILKYTYKRE